MVEHADLIGVPFVTGGRGPDGYDCFGLLREMYRRAHSVELPDFRTPDSLAQQDCVAAVERAKPIWRPVERAEANTIVLLRVGGSLSHVGFMLDDEYFVHAWRDAGGVSVDRLDNWRTRIGGFYRYAG